MPSHFQHEEDKFTKAEDINRILSEHVPSHTELKSLVRMTSNDLGNLQYSLLEIFEPVGSEGD